MTPLPCTKEKDINDLKINMAVVLTKVETIEETTGEIKDTVKGLLTAFHGLDLFKQEVKTGESIKKENEFNNWQKASIIIGAILGSAGVVAAIIVA